MTQPRAILVTILPDLKADILRQYVVNAVLFARQIGENIHFLAPENSEEAVNSAINGIPTHEVQSINTIFHLILGEWPRGVVSDAVNRYSCSLVVIPSGSITEESGYIAQNRTELLEETSSPVLVLSPSLDFAKTPIGSVLVPMSGELRISSALRFGLRLASEIHVPVDLVHVAKEKIQSESPMELIGDQSHHEYCELLDRVLAEASPFSGMRERAQVRTFYNVKGVPSVEILKIAKNTPECALVAEWHGSLIHGRAETLKNLLHQIVTPIFLLKTEIEPKAILKIGPEKRIA